MRLPLTCLILCTIASLGQSSFVPVLKLAPPPADLISAIKQQSAAEWSSMKVPKDADKEYAQLAYKKELDNLLAKFNDNHIIVYSEVTDYLQSLADHVKEANNVRNDNIRVFAYRSDVPNAASLGTGVVAMMLGLLPRLETEDQVAFVLCHELAHVVAAHNIRSIYQEATVFNNSVSKEIKQASRKQYNRYSTVAGLLEDFERGYKQHSRVFEYEADSLALQVFVKAGFDPQQALRTMDILDKVDEDPYPALDLREYFKMKTPPNQAIYSEVAKLHSQRTRPDSLSTHPNCELRKAALSRQLSRMNVSPKKDVPIANPVALASGLELVNGEFVLQNFGTSLYHSINLSNRYPNEYYFTAMVGLNLYEVYTRQKAHTLGTSVAQPDPRFAKSYNDVLVRVHRLRLTELGDATYQFMISRPEKAFGNEHFLFALWKTSMLPGSQLDPESVKSDYMNQYSHGIYSGKFK
jgi:Zn-dependent protease with chaperone function